MILCDVDLPQKLIECIFRYGSYAVLVSNEPLKDVDQFFAVLDPRSDDPRLSFLVHDILHVDFGDHRGRDVYD